MVVLRHTRPLAAFVAVLAFAGAAQAQTYRWTGASISPADSNWNNPSNWLDTGGGSPQPPNAVDHAALFDTAGNGRTSINLTGSTFTLNSLQFNTAAAAAYNIGGGGGGTLTFAANGAVTPTLVMNASVASSQIISGAVNLASSLTVTQNSASTLTISGVISGANSLTKAGVGTLILAGANPYSGLTTISAGVLQIGNGGTAGTLGTGDVTNNATLRFNRSDAVTVGGVISGGGGVTQIGTGTLYLNAANSYTGMTIVAAGTLGGTGTVSGSTIVGGSATLRAGSASDPAGTLTLANGLLTAGGSTLGVRVTTAGAGGSDGFSTDNGGVHNKLVVSSGGATLSSLMNVFVDVTGSTFSNSVQQSYRVITGAGDQSGLDISDPARFTFAGLSGVDTFDAINVSLRGDVSGNVFLSFTPVPEPAAVLGVGAAVLGLGAFIRRRRTADPAVAA